MMRSLMTAASGMKAQQMQVDTIANNIANVNTHGFKKSRLSFRSLLYETLREPGGPVSNTQYDATGLQIGTGTEISGSMRVFEQGSVEATTRALDLAIQGPGFFRVQLPNGEDRYTRNGSFRLDVNGNFVTSEGYTLVGAPTIAPGRDRGRRGRGRYGRVPERRGRRPAERRQARPVHVPEPVGLKAKGANYFSETISSGARQERPPAEVGVGRVLQGHLERSNVSAVDELVGLIVAQRNYEVNSRAIRVSDEMLQQVNQLVQ